MHCRAAAVGAFVEKPGFAGEPDEDDDDEDDDVELTADGPLHRSSSQQLKSHCITSAEGLD